MALNRVVIAGIGLTLWAVSVSAADVGSWPLAAGGEALVRIVTPADPIPADVTAAAELRDYLGRMTGARFEVIDEPDPALSAPAIYVGPTSFSKRHGIDSAGLGKEESVIRTVEGGVVITGGRPRGTLYGVYIFLEEQLGVRWYSQWCEKVPSTPTCAVGALDIRRTPHLEYRDHYGSGLPVATNAFPYQTTDWYRWVARNRLNGHGVGQMLWYRDKYNESSTGQELGGGWIPGGFPSHTFWYFFPPDDYYHKNPEFYSMRKGRRVYDSNARFSTSGNHLCLTNPKLRQLMKEKVLEMFRKLPSADFVSIGQNDGGEQTLCDCPACREFVDRHGNEADLFYDFVNPIAEAVEKEFPGKLIYTLGGYQPIIDPPLNIRPRDNIIVASVSYSNVASHIWVWDHAFSGAFVPMRYLKPRWWDLGERLSAWKQSGTPVTGLFEEDEVSYTDPILSEMYEIHPWLTAKLTENPDLDVGALVTDFVNGCFGAAGPHLVKYFRMQEERAPLWPWRMVTYDYIHRAQQLFDLAEAAVAEDPGLRVRLRDLRINMDFTTLIWRNQVIGDYRRQGGRVEDYPYRKEVLCDRLLTALSATTHPYWLHPARWCFGQRGSVTNTMRDVAQTVLERLRAGPEYLALPAELPEDVRNLPSDRLVDLSLAMFNSPSFDADPDAVLGLASRFSVKEFPFETAAYRSFRERGERDGYASDVRLVGERDVKGDGFHVYKGGRFLLDRAPGRSLLHLCYSWEYQIELNSLAPNGVQPDVWEWYVSLKFKRGPDGRFTGEALADRVILANLGSSDAVREAGGYLPPRTVRLVGRWRFEGSGENRAADAELLRMPDARIDSAAYVDGRFGKALSVNRPANVAIVPFDKRTMALANESFTLSLWFQADSAKGGQALVEQRGEAGRGFTLSLDGEGGLRFDASDGRESAGVRFSGQRGSTADGEWHRAVVGYDRERRVWFGSVDGGPVAVAPLNAWLPAEDPIWIGGGTTGFLSGAVDEVRIYLDALPDPTGDAVTGY